jgi:hypothetical protein
MQVIAQRGSGNYVNRSSLVCLFFYTTPVSLNLSPNPRRPRTLLPLVHILSDPAYVYCPTTKAVV